MISQRVTSRLAGLFYLGVAITGFFAYSARQKLMVPGDAAATVARIQESPLFFTAGMVSDIVMTALWIATAVTLYALFCRGAHRALGLAMVAFVIAGSAAVLASVLMELVAWKLVGAQSYLTSLAIEPRHALALLTLEVARSGITVASLFFGLWLFPLSFFVWRSGSFPKRVGPILAGLLVVAGLGYLADFFIAFFLPTMTLTLAPNTFWGELFLLLWLLIIGSREAPEIA